MTNVPSNPIQPVMEDEDVALPIRHRYDFQGDGVTVTDDEANGQTVVTIPGPAASQGIGVVDVGNSGTSQSINASGLGELWWKAKLTGNLTLTITNFIQGGHIRLLLTEDATGGRTVTVVVNGITQALSFTTTANALATFDLYQTASETWIVSGGSAIALSASTEKNWLWDATTATVDPNSATYITQWLTYANTSGKGIPANNGYGVATAEATASDPVYAVPQTKYTGALDAALRIPLGSQPSTGGDGHLTIRDTIAGREHDLWQAVYNSSTGRITSCSAGVSFPIGALAAGPETGGPTGNAANFPLRRCLISPEEMQAGVIAHPILIGCPNIGGGGSLTTNVVSQGDAGTGWVGTSGGGSGLGHRFPAFHNSPTAGANNGINLPEGTWMRLNPSVNVAALSVTTWEKTILTAMQQYGGFIRDNSTQLVVGYTEDCKNRGNNATMWAAAGVTGNPYNVFSAGFPLSSFQVLVQPTRRTSTAPYAR